LDPLGVGGADDCEEFAYRILKNRQGKHIRRGAAKQGLRKWIAGYSVRANACGSGKNLFADRSFVLVSISQATLRDSKGGGADLYRLDADAPTTIGRGRTSITCNHDDRS